MKGKRGGVGFLPPTEERKGILVFLVLQMSSRHQLLPGDHPSLVLLMVPPVWLHSSPAHSWARGKISYMAAATRYTANQTQHPRYTTRSTTRYTTRNTAETLPGAAFRVRMPGAAFRVRTEKLTCIFTSFLKSLKAPKMLPLPAVR